MLPARNRNSSERRASSRREVGRWVGVVNKAKASCHLWIIGLLACSLRSARVLMFSEILLGVPLVDGASLARARR